MFTIHMWAMYALEVPPKISVFSRPPCHPDCWDPVPQDDSVLPFPHANEGPGASKTEGLLPSNNLR